MKSITLNIHGMHCVSCIGVIENILNKQDGVDRSSVNIATEKANVVFDEKKIDIEKIITTVTKAGYPSELEADNQSDDQAKNLKKKLKLFLYSLILGLPLFYITMGMMIGLPQFGLGMAINITLQLVISSLIMMINYQIYANGIRRLLRRQPNMNSLVAIGTLAAYIYSLVAVIWVYTTGNDTANLHLYFESAGFILVFISLGRFLETKTKASTSEAIKKLAALQVKSATILKDGKEVEIPIGKLQINDLVIVKPGQKIPVDGIIVEGYTSIDESAITGESIPVEKKTDDTVIGSTLNKNGVITFKAKKIGADTMLSQIIKIVSEATNSKAPIQLLADKVSYYFVPAVIIIAIISLVTWLLLGQSFTFALTAFVAVLIIACPCSLGLATPTAVMVGTGLAAKQGILIKNSQALEAANTIDTIIFDKTGTLTIGQPKVVTIKNFDFDKNKLVKIAASLAKNSHHPLSEAVAKYGKENKLELAKLTDFKEIEGHGITGHCQEHKTTLALGNERLMLKLDLKISSSISAEIKAVSEQGQTPLYIAHDKKIVGIIGIMDTLKPSTQDALAQLKKMDKKIIMISGDNKIVSRSIAKKIGIDDFYAEVLPKEKADIIQKLQKNGHKVAMVGDGINDAPALAVADLGIAMSSGTDIAIEVGEIVLLKNSLEDVVKAIKISTYTLRKIKQNLFWAFIYNGAGIPIAAGILYPFLGFLLNPAIAAAAMSLSSVSVVTNSLLMKLKKICPSLNHQKLHISKGIQEK